MHPPQQNPALHTFNSAPHLSINQTKLYPLPVSYIRYAFLQIHYVVLHSGIPFEAAVHSNTPLGGVQKFVILNLN